MIKTVSCVLALVLSAAAASAQEQISVFADQGGSECSFSDASVGVKTLYVIHKDSEGSVAVQFRLRGRHGFTGAWLGDSFSPFTSIGNTNVGVSVGYGACQTSSNIVVGSVMYYMSGTSSPCSYIEVIPDSVVDNIKALTCGNFPEEHTIAGGRIYINPDEGCNCSQMQRTFSPSTPSVLAAELAAEEFGIPLDLLFAVGQARSHWEYRGGDPTDQGDYGVMALQDSESEAAASLLGAPVDSVRGSLADNVRAGAALLRAAYIDMYGEQAFEQSGTSLANWADVLKSWSGYGSPVVRQIFLRLVRKYLTEKGYVLDSSWSESRSSNLVSGGQGVSFPSS